MIPQAYATASIGQLDWCLAGTPANFIINKFWAFRVREEARESRARTLALRSLCQGLLQPFHKSWGGGFDFFTAADKI